MGHNWGCSCHCLIRHIIFLVTLRCGVVIRSEWKEFPRNETECLLYQEPQPDKFKWENKTCWMYTEQWIC